MIVYTPLITIKFNLIHLKKKKKKKKGNPFYCWRATAYRPVWKRIEKVGYKSVLKGVEGFGCRIKLKNRNRTASVTEVH
jgi:hypothetical protein